MALMINALATGEVEDRWTRPRRQLRRFSRAQSISKKAKEVYVEAEKAPTEVDSTSAITTSPSDVKDGAITSFARARHGHDWRDAKEEDFNGEDEREMRMGRGLWRGCGWA